ncbi:tripartite tricarboxylate transporter substrate binding protein [Polynucleobacter sp. IMCC 30228]|uniref:tripartite tricarboxylate transporter substrate binding protein n=1 Tax=Polynucleobacter sp. IMCC 30228 TaxID=2781011 RepID=UPI001F35397B|nr:tripartite tricarboxylate transporter substrate binding protein [Polynucleobacter sp. IMCC 30228]MCE7527130.1 tripartite tricarboxylate transporter substrate binding protein [Polynucleobacter sp. IMCC 30228]
MNNLLFFKFFILPTLGFFAAVSFALAQPIYPDRPITLVVGFSPGSSIDLVARTFAKSITNTLKIPVIIENKVGAGGNIAAELVAKSKPDGYTLLVVANSIAISPAIYPNLSFDVKKDLMAIAYLGIGPVILKVNNDLKINSIKELVSYAKANPGKLNYGSSGEGGTPHMASVLFEQTANIKMTHIPYKGGGDALAALMGGQVDILINPLLGDIKSERITSLAITGQSRSILSPDIPTFKELGYDFNVGVYYGLMGPKGMPKKTVETINQSFNNALSDPELISVLTNKSGIVMQKMSPLEFQEYLNKDMELWKMIVARNKIRD